MDSNKDQLFKKIYDLGFAYEREYRGCARSA